MFSKKVIFHKVLSFFYGLIKTKKVIVFDAPFAFHIIHLAPVINQLSQENTNSIVVICPQPLPVGLLINKNIQHVEKLPLYIRPSMFISTEFCRQPWWVECKSAFFGHGVGPKLNYVFNEDIHDYDFIYSPCLPIYDLQCKQVSSEKVIPIGLPILESGVDISDEIKQYFRLDTTKKTIIYAPSWCSNADVISPINKILNFLNKQCDINIIVSPHPLLLEEGRCNGKTFFQDIEKYQNINFNVNTPYQTFDLLAVCDAVIGDISSIMFEAMALNKTIILDGNAELYDYCSASHIYNELAEICAIPNWNANSETSLEQLIIHNKSKVAQAVFIDKYLFNRNCATQAMSAHILSEI